MATEIDQDKLLAGLLEAQIRCNNLLGAIYQQMRQDAHPRAAQQGALTNWKSANPELSKRCGRNLKRLNKMLEMYLTFMLGKLEEIEDPDNEFEISEFLYKYGQGFIQLNGIIQTISQLATT